MSQLTSEHRIGKNRQNVTGLSGNYVEERRLSDAVIPDVFVPVLDGVDLAEWIKSKRPQLDHAFSEHGALLFRGFQVRSQVNFEEALDALGLERMHYREGATPRTEVGEKVYTSTEFPAEHGIALHNELSYALTWPRRIAFCCLSVASCGGETPIADVRTVCNNIDSEILAEFKAKNWMLVRNYGENLSLPWQKVFGTNEKAEVEAYCHNSNIQCEWLGDERLRTRQVRRACAVHPFNGETLWFNHIAFWHSSSLDATVREVLVRDYGEEGIPYSTYYGDGSRIEDCTVAVLRRAYDNAVIAFPWENGDFLLLDNMLIAHGRRPYKGQRKVIVAMGDAHTRNDG
jgi:alpha-ketoglutarate-dependent taurine dioxygenase